MEVIAIDGMSGTGKTASGQSLARHLKYNFISIGYFFRTIALSEILNKKKTSYNLLKFKINKKTLSLDFYLNEKLSTRKLHGNILVDDLCSKLALKKPIRRKVYKLITNQFDNANLVIEGRSCFSVFGHIDVQFFLYCSKEERQKRIHREMKKNGLSENQINKIIIEAEKRDAYDLQRKSDPLRIHSNSVFLDSTYLKSSETLREMIFYRNLLKDKKSFTNFVMLHDKIDTSSILEKFYKLKEFNIKKLYFLKRSNGEILITKKSRLMIEELNGVDSIKDLPEQSICFFVFNGSSIKKKIIKRHIKYHYNTNNALVISMKKGIPIDYSEFFLKKTKDIDLSNIDLLSVRGTYLKYFLKTFDLKGQNLRRNAYLHTCWDIDVQKNHFYDEIMANTSSCYLKYFVLDAVLKEGKNLFVIEAGKIDRHIGDILLYIQNDYFKKHKTHSMLILIKEDLSEWLLIIQTKLRFLKVGFLPENIWQILSSTKDNDTQ